MKDKAKRKSDKLLANTERKIDGVYANSLALRRLMSEYSDYMKDVGKKTNDLYDAYQNESDPDQKALKKEAYKKAVKKLTLESTSYTRLTQKIVSELSKLNQEALDLVNVQLDELYAISYNQVSVECRKAGIKVNGKP